MRNIDVMRNRFLTRSVLLNESIELQICANKDDNISITDKIVHWIGEGYDIALAFKWLIIDSCMICDEETFESQIVIARIDIKFITCQMLQNQRLIHTNSTICQFDFLKYVFKK